MISAQPSGAQVVLKRVTIQNCHELLNCRFVATAGWNEKIVFFIA
jgi:hypothetical protein